MHSDREQAFHRCRFSKGWDIWNRATNNYPTRHKERQGTGVERQPLADRMAPRDRGSDIPINASSCCAFYNERVNRHSFPSHYRCHVVSSGFGLLLYNLKLFHFLPFLRFLSRSLFPSLMSRTRSNTKNKIKQPDKEAGSARTINLPGHLIRLLFSLMLRWGRRVTFSRSLSLSLSCLGFRKNFRQSEFPISPFLPYFVRFYC